MPCDKAGNALMRIEVIQIILLYVLAINVTGFLVMGIDKRRSRRRAWRVSEATLFAIAVFGGRT